MRILVCSKRDFPGCYFLNRLLPELAAHELTVWLSDVARPAESLMPELAEIAFIERDLFVEDLFPVLDRLPPSARQGAALLTFQGLRERHGIEVTTVGSMDAPESAARLGQLAPDLIVSARYSHIFEAAAIAAPRHGIVNLHPGGLPRFAGLFAPMRSVCAGLEDLSGTLHWVDEGIDTGPILAWRTRALDHGRGLLPQIAEVYCDLIEPLLDLIDKLASGARPTGEPQDRSRREYRSLPSAADIAQFRATGMVFWKPGEISAWIHSFLPSQPPARPVDPTRAGTQRRVSANAGRRVE